MQFSIPPISNVLDQQIAEKVNGKTKPLGSLGCLEALATRIAAVQGSLEPKLVKPTIVVFAADHGVAAEESVSQYPQEVTWQMVLNFLSGGAAINVFSRQHGIELKVVDAGVNYDFEPHDLLVDAKIARGTQNYLKQPAMTKGQLSEVVAKGAEVVRDLHAAGSNVLGFGDMGIGNTSSASLLMSELMNLPLEQCVGAGAGLQDDGVKRKLDALKRAQDLHGGSADPLGALRNFGGFEIAMICGAMLQAAELGVLIIVDGFIVTSALLVAHKICPAVTDYCVYAHCSDESGHAKMLEFLDVEPLLKLGMRLGEGSGAAVCYPLLVSAVGFLNEMASFESASVSQSE